MSDEHGRLPSVPPEWVRLTDAPSWIAQIYEVDERGVAIELILAVRRGIEIRHRVTGILAGSSAARPKLPKGLMEEIGVSRERIFVSDWEAAQADFESGTVGGWESDNIRTRLPVEVSWISVENFAVIRLLSRRQAMSPPIQPTGQKTALPERSGGQGRPTSMHLIRAKLEHRISECAVLPTMAAESRALSIWLRENHPDSPPLGDKAIRNSGLLKPKLRDAVIAAARNALKRRPE